MSIRGKIRRRIIKAVKEPPRRIRPMRTPWLVRIRGVRAELAHTRKVDRQLTRMKDIIEQYRGRWISGNFSRRPEYGPRAIRTITIAEIIGATIGSGIAGWGWMKREWPGQLVPFAAASGIIAGHLSSKTTVDAAKRVHHTGRNYAFLLQAMKGKLFPSVEGIISQRRMGQNKATIIQLEQALQRMHENNRREQERLETLLKKD